MQNPQTATLFFFGPVAAAYLVGCGGWLVYDWLRPRNVGNCSPTMSDRPYLDFLLTFVAAGGILLLGAVYRQGWLFTTGERWIGRCGWLVDTLIIYSPIAAVLVFRRQGSDTVFLTSGRLVEKIGLGLGLGVAAVALYLALRGELKQFPDCLAAAISLGKLSNFLPVFLEGVAVAFALVRMRWLVGMATAVAIPALLFAAAHIPGQVAEGRTLMEIAAFFVFNGVLVTAILWTVQRSRDVIWLGLVHYLMDIAIRAI